MHITHICPRFKEIHGGGEPVLFNLFQELSELGFKNTIHTYNYPDSMRLLLDSRVEMKELPRIFNRNFENVLLAGFYDLFCSSFLSTGILRDTDVLCFHTENVIPALLFYKLARGRKPTLYFCFQPPRFAYDTTSETASSGGALGHLLPIVKSIYRPLDRLVVRLADRIATFSNGYRAWIEEIYDIRDVKVLPPGVERPEKIAPLPEGISNMILEPGCRKLLFAGKLVSWKNVDRLINVLGIIKRENPSVLLLIVGDGPCMEALIKQVSVMGLEDSVVFCGYVPAEKVFSYYSVSDIFVLLEQNASFGLSLIEANSVGLPVMAFEGGGPSDIIEEGNNGFLLPTDITDEEIAERILTFLEDEDKMNSMRNNAVSVANEYTWRRFGKAFAETVKDLAC